MTQRRPHPSLRSRVRHLETRDTSGWIWLDQVAQDLRYGFRLPLKNRSFTLVAVSTLALGIGSIASLYSIFDSTYLHTGPAVTHPVDETVLLAQQSTKQAELWRFSAPEYFDIARLHQSFDGFFAMHYWTTTLSENLERSENPERVVVLRVTSTFSLWTGYRQSLGEHLHPMRIGRDRCHRSQPSELP